MRLSAEQYEFIKGEVVALFERYDVRCIPISGFELAYTPDCSREVISVK